MLDFPEAHPPQPLSVTNTSLDILNPTSPLEKITEVQGVLTPNLESVPLRKFEAMLPALGEPPTVKKTAFSEPAVAGTDLFLGTRQLLVGDNSTSDDLLGNWGKNSINREIVFVDAAITDEQSLIRISPSAEIIRLDDGRDGINQITEVLSQRHNTSAVHILSHGSTSSLQLGSATLDQKTLEQYRTTVQGWGSALTEDADILFYGCDVAQGEVGQAFVQQLSALTKADVAASVDLTGNTALGGNWTLEYKTGNVEAIALAADKHFTEVLSTVKVDNGKLIVENNFIHPSIVEQNAFSISADNVEANLLISDLNNNIIAGAGASTVANNSKAVTVSLDSFSSLEIKGGLGDDSVTFSGNLSFTKLTSLNIQGEAGKDTVTFTNNLFLKSANLEVTSENITVSNNVILSTRKLGGSDPLSDLSTGNSGNLTFTGKTITLNDGAKLLTHVDTTSSFKGGDISLKASETALTQMNLIPSPVLVDTKKATLAVGQGSVIQGNNIKLEATAADKNLQDELPQFVEFFGLGDELKEYVSDLTALPVKVLVKKSEATVTVGQNTRIRGSGNVSLNANAVTESNGSAGTNKIIEKNSGKSIPLSIGYARADATAKTDIQTGVQITADKSVDIIADASATAKISASTEKELDQFPGTGQDIAAGLAISDSNTTSHATVATGATIKAGNNANVRAIGGGENTAEGEAGVYQDGRVGVSAGLGFSDADIKTTVDGTITANGGLDTKIEFDPDNNQMIDYENNTIDLGKEGRDLHVGDKITYSNGGGESIGISQLTSQTLEDGGTYYAIVDESNPTKLKLARTKDQALAGNAIDLQSQQQVSFNPSQAAGANNSILINNHGFKNGQAVVYKSNGGTAIQGLKDGNTYYAIVDTQSANSTAQINTLQLAESETAAEAKKAITLNLSKATGSNHILAEQYHKQDSFNPSQAAGEDNTVLTIKNHGFRNGQAVVYNSNGGTAIGGLEDGKTYYIIVDTSEANLDGDSALASLDTLRLAASDSAAEAEKAITLDLSKATGSNHTLTAQHVFDSGRTGGIGVLAELESNNAASGTSGSIPPENSSTTVSGSTTNNQASTTTSNQALTSKIFQALTQKYSQKTNSPGTSGTGASASGAKSNLAATAALAFSDVDNTVTATVGSNARLESEEDIDVKATVVEQVQLISESSVAPSSTSDSTDAGSGTTSGTGTGSTTTGSSVKDQAISAAVVFGDYNNTAKATIQQNAQLDAKGAFNVISEVSYPYLKKPEEHFDPGKIDESFKAKGISALEEYTENLGIQNLFNTWARSTAKADKLGIAGSVNFTDYTNVSEAIVETGVLINQDPAYRSEDQLVYVAGATAMQLVNLTGEVDLRFKPSLGSDGNKGIAPKLPVGSPMGSQNQQGGVGGALFLQFANNTTTAKIKDGAKVHSDGNGVKINAEDHALNFSFAQAGAKGGKFGVGGTFSFIHHNSNTLAQLESGVTVTGQALEVKAESLGTHINVTGSVVKGKNTGVGVTVGINDIDRQTNAIIGDNTMGVKTSIDVAGDVEVNTENDGFIGTFSLAAAIQSDPGNDPPAQQAVQPQAQQDSDPLDGVSLAALFDDGNSPFNDEQKGQQSQLNNNTKPQTNNTGKYGIGISGDVSINSVEDNTNAYIYLGSNDTGKIKSDAFSVQSDNSTHLIAASGSAAIASSKQANSRSAGIAGSFSFNQLSGQTQAYILGADTVINNELELQAKRKGKIYSLAAGGSGASGQSSSTAVAGSVAINIITNTTDAFLDSVTGTVKDTTSLEAKDESAIWAIAGALAVAEGTGSANGFGAALSFNRLNTTTQSQIKNNTNLSHKGLSLTATTDSDIRSLSASLGIAAGTQGTGAAGTISFNIINNTTDASIQGSTLTGTGDISLTSEGLSDIISIAGAVGASKGNGFGVAGAYNRIGNNISAYIDQSTVSTTSGNLSLIANSSGEIQTLSGGVAIGGANGITGAGSVSVNNIASNTKAYIANNSTVNISGSVDITAKDDSVIQAFAGAVAAGGTAAGASIGINFINNDTLTYINNSTVDATGNISLQATSLSEIDVLTIGGAGGNNFAFGGSLSVNIIGNTINSYIDNNNKRVKAGQNITLTAKDESITNAIGGGIGISTGSSAVGAAISVNITTNDVRAYTNAATVESQAGVVSLDATSIGLINSLTIGGSFGNNFALSGAVSVNILNNSVEAAVKGGSAVTANRGINLNPSEGTLTPRDSKISQFATAVGTAISDSDIPKSGINALAGGFAGSGGGSAIGGAVAVNVTDNEFSAYIENSSATSAAGNIILNANSIAAIDSITIGGAMGGGSLGLGGSISTNIINNDTQAYIKGGTVDAYGSVAVLANTAGEIDLKAGGLGVGSSAGIGGSVIINTITNTTEAFIANNSTVNAKGNTALTVPLADGSGGTTSVRGVAVIATSNEAVTTLTANGGFGGTAGVAAMVSVNVISDTTLAYIAADSTVNNNTGANSQQAVAVKAFNSTDVDVKGGSLAIGGTAGVGAASDTTVISNTTKAYIDSASVTAQRTVNVTSFTKERFNAVVASGAGGGTAGVAGNVGVVVIKSTNEAYLNRATVKSSGSLNVVADNKVVLGDKLSGVTIGGVAVGGVAGVGGSVFVASIGNTTTAHITDSTTNAKGLTKVDANSSENVTVKVGTGTGGVYAGVAGTVIVNSISTTTQAYINETTGFNTLINQDSSFTDSSQAVQVSAKNTTNLNTGAGSVGAGAVGAGASVDVGSIENVTTAYLDDGTQVKAHDVSVTANSNHTANSKVLAFGGGIVALQGAISVLNIGSAISQAGKDALNNKDVAGEINKQVRESATVGGETGNSAVATQARNKVNTTGNSLSIADVFNTNAVVSQGTSAYIGNNVVVNAGGKIIVDADSTASASADAGAAGVGLAAIGASVSVINLKHSTSSVVGDNANLTAGSDIVVDAASNQTVTATTTALQGGIRSGSGCVTNVEVAPTVTASIGSSANLKATTGNITIASSGKGNVVAKAKGISAGGTSVGISLVNAQWNPTVTASVGDFAQLTSGNNITIQALTPNLENSVTATANPSAGSLLGSGVGADADVKVNAKILADVGEGANLKAGNNLTLSAQSYNSADAKADGKSFGLFVGAGSSRTSVEIINQVEATTEAEAKLYAKKVTLEAQSNNNGLSNAVAGTAGAIAFGGSKSESSLTNITVTRLGDRAQVNSDLNAETLPGKNRQLEIKANSSTNLVANVKQDVNGLGADNEASGSTKINSLTRGTVGEAAQVNVNQFTLSAADNNVSVSNKATAYSAGAYASVDANATLDATLDSEATIGQNAKIIALDSFTIAANQQLQNVSSEARADADGLIAPDDAFSRNNLNATAKVSADRTVIVVSNIVVSNAAPNVNVGITPNKPNNFTNKAFEDNDDVTTWKGKTESSDRRNIINNFYARSGLSNAVVDLLTDENDGNTTKGDISLREAIALAGIGGVVTFSEQIAGGTITLTAGQLLINQDITIQGGNKGITISGNNASRVLDINDGQVSAISVILKGLTIVNGSASNGGGIKNQENLTFSNGKIANNRSQNDGGGIYNDNGGTLILDNLILENNIATTNGGGIANLGGSVTVTNSLIRGNSARDGGGIANIGATALLQVTASQIDSNSVQISGGGILNQLGTATVTNTTLRNNTAATGGAIANFSGNAAIANSTLNNNSASSKGGGIFQQNLNSGASTLNLTNSTLSSNTATNTGGGISQENGLVNIRNSTITQNSAATGSGVISSGTQATVRVLSSIVSGNANNDDVSGSTFISDDFNLIGGGNATNKFGIERIDSLQNPIDANTTSKTTYVFLTDSLAKELGASGNGLPDNGVFAADANHPEVRLAHGTSKEDNNARRVVGGQSFTFSLAAAEQNQYNTLHLIAASTQGKTSIDVKLTYADGSIVTYTRDVPDWFDDPGVEQYQLDDINVFPQGQIYFLANELDRIETNNISASGVQNANDAAIFGFSLALDPTKTLASFTVTNQDAPSDQSNLIFFGATGKTASSTVQLDVSSLFNSDAVANKFTRDRVGVTNPKLAPLANNEGLTETHALLPDSPAINSGGNPDNLNLDQRGIFRVNGGRIDIGAYELQKDPVIVSNIVDGDDGDYSDGNLSLREAIAHSESDSIITFSPELANSTIALTEGELVVDRNLTVNGSDRNITVDALGENRVFRVDDGDAQNKLTVTLNNITITGGRVAGSGTYDNNDRIQGVGGGLLNRENLTINDSTITGNKAEDAGGGIYNDAGTLTINRSTLSNNSAVRLGIPGQNSIFAFRYGVGGGLRNTTGTVTFNSSTISNNKAGAGGGGISNASTLIVSNTTISGNELAPDEFGGIRFGTYGANGGGGTHNTGSAQVRNSTITNNFRNTQSRNISGIESGIQSSQGSFTLVSSILAGNQDGKDGSGYINAGNNLINTDPKLTPLQNNGGATLTHALLANSPAFNKGSNPDNLSTDQRGSTRVIGSSIDIGAFESQLAKPIFTAVVDTLVDEFDADFSAGDFSLREAIAAVESGGTVTFSNSLLNGKITLTQGALEINKNITISAKDRQIVIDASGRSRIFKVDDGNKDRAINVEIEGLTLTGGSAIAPGIAGHGGAILNLENLTLRDSTVTGNKAVSGGGIANGFDYTQILKVSHLDKPISTSFTAEGTLKLFDTIITNNTTLVIPDGIVTEVSNAGETRITTTITKSNGGGISSKGNLTITDNTISANSAGADGGGIANEGSLTITNSQVNNNIAKKSGGGIYQRDTFTPSNRAISGRLYYHNTFTIRNSTISGNSAGADGGGLHVTADMQINALFYNNANLVRSTLSNNSAGNRGGGIFNTGAVKTTESTIAGNRANLGGSIYNDTLGILHLKNSTVSGNAATKGGGIFDSRKSDTSSWSRSFVSNSTISSNSASSSGGGIYKQSFASNAFDLTIGNSTITNNRAVLGSGVRLEVFDTTFSSFQQSTQVFSSIISGNFNNDDVSSELRQSVIGQKERNLFQDGRNVLYSNAANIIGGGNAKFTFGKYNPAYAYGTNSQVDITDAKLGSLQNNGGLTNTHALLPGSPAINLGVALKMNGSDNNGLLYPDSNLTTDQRGDGYNRIVGSGIDIGAYEVQQMIEVGIANRSIPESRTTQATVTRQGGDLTKDLVVALTSSNPSGAIVPETVTILAGQKSASFTITGVDDGIINAVDQRIVTISASAPSYLYSGKDTLEITDDTLPDIFLTLDQTVLKEGDRVTATVKHNLNTTKIIGAAIDGFPSDEVEVLYLSTSSDKRSAYFSISGKKDNLVDAEQTVTLKATATVPIWEADIPTVLGVDNIDKLRGRVDFWTETRDYNGNPATLVFLNLRDETTVNVLNIDTPTLSLNANPKTISERGETATVTVSHNIENLSEDLVIALSSSDTTEATINPSITIAANNSTRSTTFNLTAVDDNLPDGIQPVTVSATKAGFATGTTTINIVSDELIVTNTNDSGEGSLRQAIADANLLPGADSIFFDASLSGQTITLTSGELKITGDTIINGLGKDTITVSGNNNSRVFAIDDGNFSNQTQVTIDGLTITKGNSAGGILNQESLSLSNSTVSNHAGVGVDNKEGSLNISNSTISGNADIGIYNRSNKLVAINNSTIVNNQSGILSGSSNSSATITLTNSTISGNSGGTTGGIYLLNSTATITDSTISNNHNGSREGSGIRSIASNLTVTGSEITSNNGIGIFNAGFSTVTVTNSTIKSNSVHGIKNENSNFNLSNSIVSDSSYSGIYNKTNGTLTISDSTITRNTSKSRGGGINNQGILTISNSTIAYNSAGFLAGGGIYNRSNLTISNSTISNNTAPSYGGGIENRGNLSIANSTITKNQAPKGSGVNSPDNVTSLSSTIVAGNANNDDVVGRFNSGGYNLIGGGSAASSFGGTVLDLTQDSIDTSDYALITDEAAKVQDASTGNGLPNNGYFASDNNHPNVQLAYGLNKGGNNARFAIAQESFEFSVSNDQYKEVHLFALSTNGSSDMKVDFTYTDGNTISASNNTVPDWFDETSPSNPYKLVDNLDRTSTTASRFENNNDPAIFGFRFALDPNKTLARVKVTNVDGNADTSRLVFFGATGVTTADKVVQMDVSAILNKDVIVDLVDLVNTNQTGVTDPRLAPLANNGGATFTHALLSGSPAINAGSNPNNLTTDQRGSGFARQVGSSTDVGAVEAQQLLQLAIAANSISEAGGQTQATVTRFGLDTSKAVVVNLSSDDATEVSLPETVTIPIGQQSASFTITGVDDQFADGTKTVAIATSAPGFITNDAVKLAVIDNETPNLTLSLNSQNLNEGGTAIATLSSNREPTEALVVNLSSSNDTEVTLPKTITIPVGATSVNFTISGVDDGIVDGTQTVTLTATAAGFPNATTRVNVLNRNTPTLSLSIAPKVINEKSGTATVTLKHYITNLTQDLVVNLSNSDLTEVTIPTTVTIPVGAKEKTFTLTALDDDSFDGTQTVTITATANGFTAGTDTVSVISDELLVTNTNDSGAGSLRKAIADANATSGRNYIAFDSQLMGQTITLTSGALEITDDLTIQGLGKDQLTISGNRSSRVFFIYKYPEQIDVTLNDLTITNGTATNTPVTGFYSYGGGAIFNYTEKLTISSSVISNSSATSTNSNRQQWGGGIYNNQGLLTINNSVISGNFAKDGAGIGNRGGTVVVSGSEISRNSSNFGAGIENNDWGNITISNSTISSNTASSQGGGIKNQRNLSIVNSTITKNQAPQGSGIYSPDNATQITSTIVAGNTNNVDVVGQFNSSGYNLIGSGQTGGFTATGDRINITDPKLGVLQNNGGATSTHAPLLGSPAIDAGSNPNSLTTDQRGRNRVVGAGIDIGAVERGGETNVVDTLLDENDGNFSQGKLSLREAIAASTPGDMITFSNSLAGGIVVLSQGQLQINKNLTIDGTGKNITIRGNNASRVFIVDDGSSSTSSVILTGVEITGGRVSGDGGGILNRENLTISNSTISGNSATGSDGDGGGLYNNKGTVSLQNSTVSGNSATGDGGGLYNYSGSLAISNSTIASNSASSGSGVYNKGNFKVTVESSIIAANTNDTDVVGNTNNFNSKGYNLIGGGNRVNNFNNLDTTQDSFDNNNYALITDEAAKVLNPSQGNGLPNNGFFATDGNHPDVQLAYGLNKGGNNARISLAQQNFQFAVPANAYSQVHLFALSTEGNTSMQVEFTYTDGTKTTSNSTVPDWFDDPTSSNPYALVNGLDRTQTTASSLEDSNDPAIFGFRFDLNTSKTLASIKVINTDSGTDSSRLVFLGATGVTATNATVQIDVSSILDKDAIVDRSVTDRTSVTDPRLERLKNNGGNTSTHALLSDSPALNAGSNPNGLTTDQRGSGFNRVEGGIPDIGAFEFQVNDPPSSLSLQNALTSLAENTDTTTRIPVADIAIADDGLGTNTLSLTGADAAKFEIVNNKLYLKAGTILNYETQRQLQVTVAVDDTTVGNTPDSTAPLTIAITDVNEAPTLSLQNSTTKLSENTNTTTRVKVANIAISDDALGTNTLSLTGADANQFEIQGTELFLKAGIVLDFQTNPQLDVTVAVSDNTAIGSPTNNTASLSITITKPEINLKQGSTALAVGATHNFGAVGVTSGSTELTFTIENSGDAPLSLNNLTLSRVNASDFSFVGNLPSGQIEAGQNATFIVRFDPTATGVRTATLTLASSDRDEASYTITLTGTGSSATAIAGTNSSETIYSQGGDNTIDAGGGDDRIDGASGGEYVLAGDGVDTINGGDGNDRLNGDNGNDIIRGGTGSDLLRGGNDDDELYGDEGNDNLIGDVGNDRLDGSAGSDRLRGVTGSDTFVLQVGQGSDIIYDFNVNEDRFELIGLTVNDLSFETSGSSSLIKVGTTTIAQVSNVTVAQLQNYFTNRHQQ